MNLTIDRMIVGLGNPETGRQQTRHNAGFRTLELLAPAKAFAHRADLQADIAVVPLQGRTVLLAKPTTTMNLSGQSVVLLLQTFALTPEQMLLVHDDLSRDMGRLKFQHGGSAGGHNGVKSVIADITTDKFDRLKVAVGPDPGGALRLAFVLLDPIAAELVELYQRSLALAADAVRAWIASGCAQASNRFNAVDAQKTGGALL